MKRGVSTTEVLDNRGVRQKTTVVTEAGLYEVIFMSRKPDIMINALMCLKEERAARAKAEVEAQRPVAALVTPAGQSYFANILSK